MSTHVWVALKPSNVTVARSNTTIANTSLALPSFSVNPIANGLIFNSLVSALLKHS